MGKRLIIPGADFTANAAGRDIPYTPVEYTLQNGFASRGTTGQVVLDNHASSNLIRVRTSQIRGDYSVKTKPGYVIRAILAYDTEITITGPGSYNNTNVENIANVQGLSEYSLTGAGTRWSIITFCKEDATAEISASENIVDYIVRFEE